MLIFSNSRAVIASRVFVVSLFLTRVIPFPAERIAVAAQLPVDNAPNNQEILVSPSTVTLGEEKFAVFGIKLALPLTDDLVVNAAPSNGKEKISFYGSTNLTFTPLNWDAEQTII